MKERTRERLKMFRAFGRSFPGVAAVAIVLCLGATVVGSSYAGLRLMHLPLAVSGSGQERLLPIYSVQREDKEIAISFDAAWGDEHTQSILDNLDQYNIKATFFLVDFWASKFPDDVKAIAAKGHEIGNHSASHPDMAKLSKEQIEKELNTTADTIESIAGVRPTLFRPPFGSYNNTLIQTCEELGYKVIQWEVDSLDWKDISTEQIVERVTRNVKPGSIVLFHNNAEHVEEYLPLILKKLTEDGYKIVPIGQLIYRENYTMDHTGKQIPNS